jgi:hypothetical protein
MYCEEAVSRFVESATSLELARTYEAGVLTQPTFKELTATLNDDAKRS